MEGVFSLSSVLLEIEEWLVHRRWKGAVCAVVTIASTNKSVFNKAASGTDIG